MEQYSNLSTFELRKKLKNYGYRNLNSLSREQLKNSAIVADVEQKLVSQYRETPVDFSKLSVNRCNALRKQRFIPKIDKFITNTILFSGLLNEVDFSAEDIEEYLWLSVYSKKENSFTIHALLKLKNNYYVYFDLEFDGNEVLSIKISKDYSHSKIINTILTNEQYYWYKKATEIASQLSLKRKTEERTGHNFVENTNNIIYIMFKIQKEPNIRIFNLNDENIEFDYMTNFSRIYWLHLNLTTNMKNYILYKSMDNVFTLIKFKYEIKMINEIPVANMRMVKVYLSNNYEDIINKVLTHKEYEMYMNETD